MLLAVATLLALPPEGLSRVDARAPQDAAALRTQALDLAYNLDHDAALDLLRRAVAQAPSDPAAHRTLAGVAWQKILFGRGTVTVDHYLGSFSRADVDVGKPPPQLDAEFRRHVDRAIALAEARVAANKRDTQAHYDLGAALGLHASYVAAATTNTKLFWSWIRHVKTRA